MTLRKISSQVLHSTGSSRKQSQMQQPLQRTAMPKVERFDIEFDSMGDQPAVYFAGQQVSGRAILELRDEKRVNGILMEFKGRARTYWTKHSGKSRQHCSDSEPYFCEQFNTNYTDRLAKQTSEEGKEVCLVG